MKGVFSGRFLTKILTYNDESFLLAQEVLFAPPEPTTLAFMPTFSCEVPCHALPLRTGFLKANN
ncbi:hypothetical protein DSO57_1014921 [Entomophthora muscae]|uniref:Uncharacterized protein n=1 Tax=Entomophthora muscae TaxID=34485 RepID=A0ACC2U3M0_9FUNG|nr:hypothetical protein DSO57_1014921 [Entomophthora muscae]